MGSHIRVGTERLAVAPQPTVYVIGSLRGSQVPTVAIELRKWGYDAFDDWYAAGPEADDKWQAYEQARGRTYAEALQGYAAGHVFAFDKEHLDRADAGVLVLPAGKSGHLELGYLAGRGTPTFVLFAEVPERWDVMYQFSMPCFGMGELRAALGRRVPA